VTYAPAPVVYRQTVVYVNRPAVRRHVVHYRRAYARPVYVRRAAYPRPVYAAPVYYGGYGPRVAHDGYGGRYYGGFRRVGYGGYRGGWGHHVRHYRNF
jgi:hypothetical protein